MKPVETMRHLEVRNLAALGLCCALAVFIGFMITGQFHSHSRDVSEKAKSLSQDLEKRVSSVGYFFSERYADLENLGVGRELTGYFENQALGMSMKYGLQASLYAAVRRFSLIRSSKMIGKDPIYRRLVFILDTGDILIDTQGAPDQFPGFCAHLLSPGVKPREILASGTEMAVSVPFYFKGGYTGQLVSFPDPEALDRNLVRHSGDTGRFFCLAVENEPVFLPGGVLAGVPERGRIAPGQIPVGQPRTLSVKGARSGLLALRGQIPGTPFSIVSLAQAEAVSGSAVLVTLGAFALFLATAIFFIWRAATQRLIVGVRLSESIESEKRFRDLVEFLPIPIWEYDFDLTLRFANQKALDFFGFSKDDIGKKLELAQLVPEVHWEMVKERHRAHAAGESPGPVDMGLKRKNGSAVWGRVIPANIYDKGKPVGIRICFLDMTRQRRLEQETIKAAEQEKFALVGQVAGKMAHDFNNILSAIMGNAELSLLDCQDPDIARTLELILEQAKRGNILTRNLVAFSKDQEIREEFFNINDKVDLVLNLLKKELERVTVIKRYQDNPPELLADPGMIEHALVNLVQNAIHAMGKTPHPVLGLETASDGSHLTIAIQDNGCGIPEAYADKIYSPSFSLKGSRDFTGSYSPDIKGTGYGLSNVKKYIDKHKGSISFVSKEGKGTRFSVTLPLRARSLFPEEKEELLRKPVVTGKHVLVVEDEPAISMVLCKILSSDPFFHEVSLAENGEQAMALMDKAGASFDLVSLDYMLPGKMTGLDVYAAIREPYPSLPIVFISGNMRFLESIAGLKTSDHFVDHLPKPFENRQYADKINQWLQAGQ